MRIEAPQSLILTIDMQDRLLGAIPETKRNKVIQNSAHLLAAATTLEIPCLATAQYPQGLGPIRPDLRSFCSQSFDKTVFSCWRHAPLRNLLETGQSRRQIILTGVETHICVLQTALDLHSAGWQPVVVADACASRDDANGQSALLRLRQAGITVAVAESVFYEWLGDAAHPQFRSLAPAWR
ncbi:isochorismatase family protein [Acidithiobacillus sp. HP-6]|uniref:isochorismatase family protein n=1 Tax=unclassified Acidithiobacillus TaxID=2614800 RepID=UPI001879A369|nr:MULTISPECIES: isochorismatase family protein [unclassified Acidithiobacillus]MBE7563824.1 isochorismatase family protein [Acidithiobacillus sp. HP-6]MBE7570431.1 isochorismatase family protein [Acidithiobacillus sp. HP-2]MDD2748561.1 isochorismatase family protein [Acidithiobacillus sp.]MDD5279846.1 isochorismatase family protein [Acidithiobacillus sp.]